MNRVLCLLAMCSFVLPAFGCVSNKLECDETVEVSKCIDNETLEFCSYGERSQFKCTGGKVCKDGKNANEDAACR